MADTRLSDIIEPVIFAAREFNFTTRLDGFIQSGIVATSDLFDARAVGDGDVTDMPFWNDLTSGESNVATDDPSILSTPDNINMGLMIARRNHREKDWGAMDLVATVLGQDPLSVIAERVAKYWIGDRANNLFAMLRGIELSNVANNGGDMIYNIATDANTAVTAAEKLSANTVLEAKQTMGDWAGNLTGIAMHSRLQTNLVQQQNPAYIQYANREQADVNETGFYDTYLGYRVFVDDSMPVVLGTYRPTYTSYLFGMGAFGLGTGAAKVPTEVWRNPAAGRGSGEERLYSRKVFILHPKGFSCTATAASGKSPTNAEYAVAAAWSRQVPRKKVPFAIIKTNG